MEIRVNLDALKAIRELRDLSLRQMALQVGVSHSYLSQIEAGRKIPKLAVASRMARALGVPLASFYELRDKPSSVVTESGVTRAS